MNFSRYTSFFLLYWFAPGTLVCSSYNGFLMVHKFYLVMLVCSSNNGFALNKLVRFFWYFAHGILSWFRCNSLLQFYWFALDLFFVMLNRCWELLFICKIPESSIVYFYIELSVYFCPWMNCFIFLGAFMQQGIDITPRSVSGRIVGNFSFIISLFYPCKT